MTRLLIPPIAALVTNYDVTDVAKVLKLPDLNANVFISFMLQELNALKPFAISLVPDARWRCHVTDWRANGFVRIFECTNRRYANDLYPEIVLARFELFLLNKTPKGTKYGVLPHKYRAPSKQ